MLIALLFIIVFLTLGTIYWYAFMLGREEKRYSNLAQMTLCSILVFLGMISLLFLSSKISLFLIGNCVLWLLVLILEFIELSHYENYRDKSSEIWKDQKVWPFKKDNDL